MEYYNFYKSIYDRELARRKDLEAAINIPIAIVSILVGLLSYSKTNYDFKIKTWTDFVIMGLMGLSISLLLASILYLVKSYNNFFKGHDYINLPPTAEIRNYQIKELPDYNNQCTDEADKLDFDNIIIEWLNKCTDSHIIINDKRSNDLYLAKALIIGAMLVTLIGMSVLFAKKYLL